MERFFCHAEKNGSERAAPAAAQEPRGMRKNFARRTFCSFCGARERGKFCVLRPVFHTRREAVGGPK